VNETSEEGGGLTARAYARRAVALASVVALALLAACAHAEPVPFSPGHWVDRSGTYSVTLDADGSTVFALPLKPGDAQLTCDRPGDVAVFHGSGTWDHYTDGVGIRLPDYHRSITVYPASGDDWSEMLYYPCFLETPIVMVKEVPAG
jgi:hypothetical protein